MRIVKQDLKEIESLLENDHHFKYLCKDGEGNIFVSHLYLCRDGFGKRKNCQDGHAYVDEVLIIPIDELSEIYLIVED